jgi:hypothetical protein
MEEPNLVVVTMLVPNLVLVLGLVVEASPDQYSLDTIVLAHLYITQVQTTIVPLILAIHR